MCALPFFFLYKQKTAYEMRISDWSSDVCSSDLQARRGEGGGDHAAFTDSAKSSNETGTPWLSAISLIGTQYLDGILRGPSAHALTDTGLIMMPRATSAEWTAWGPPNFLEAVY